jgi:hypothetical protein
MIRRGTWIALLVLLALVGFSFALRNRQTRNSEAATATQGLSPLFDELRGEPSLIRIESAVGQSIEIARNADGTWVLEAPEKAEADQAAAQAAATQIGALRVLSTVNLAPEIIGMDAPAYELTLKFEDGSKHTLLIGSVTPITDGYYTQLNSGPYQVVDKYGLDSLIELVGAPPYLATPTPQGTSSAMPSATPFSASPPAADATMTNAAGSQEPTTATATP